jgi:transposase-like protein
VACPRADVEPYAEDKPPVFILADRGSGDQYVIPVKAANESTIRLLLAVGQQESLTVYTDGFLRFRFEKCTSKFRGRTNGDILGP